MFQQSFIKQNSHMLHMQQAQICYVLCHGITQLL